MDVQVPRQEEDATPGCWWLRWRRTVKHSPSSSQHTPDSGTGIPRPNAACKQEVVVGMPGTSLPIYVTVLLLFTHIRFGSVFKYIWQIPMISTLLHTFAQ